MLKRLAALLGFLCLVLLLLAFDEGQVERGLSTVREQAGPAAGRLIEAARGRDRASVAPRGTAPAGASPTGAFIPLGDPPGGGVTLEKAVIAFAEAPPLRTRPHRIAFGRDGFAAPLALPADHQIELREVVPMDARTPPAPSPLCGGGVPAWVAVTRRGDRLELMVWPAGPPPDASGAGPCLRATYRADGR